MPAPMRGGAGPSAVFLWDHDAAGTRRRLAAPERPLTEIRGIFIIRAAVPAPVFRVGKALLLSVPLIGCGPLETSSAAYGRGAFYVAYLGRPSATGLWQLQFGGHHLAVANTYRDGALIGATPSFRGMEPAGPFAYGGQTNLPQIQEITAFQELLASLKRPRITAGRAVSILSPKAGRPTVYP